MLKHGRADVVSIGFLISLWAGSSATATFVNTITIAYGMRHQRNAWRSRLLAFELYLLGRARRRSSCCRCWCSALARSSTWFPTLKLLVQIAYWPVVALISMAGVATLYHLSLPGAHLVAPRRAGRRGRRAALGGHVVRAA